MSSPVHSVNEIQRWPLPKIYHEIDDQKQFLKDCRRDGMGFDTTWARQYLDNLFEALKIINARRNRRWC